MNEIPRHTPPGDPLLSPPPAGPKHAAQRGHVPRAPLIGAVVVVLAALALGAFNHWSIDRRAEATQRAAVDFRPQVRVATAELREGPIKLTQPGTILPFDQANIYARSTGYIAERKVDIGSRVHAGDLLVRISAPDLDAQLQQAQAQLGQMQAQLIQSNANVDQARANLYLAGRTNARTSQLASQGWETMQNADNTQTSLNTNAANLESALAGVKVAEANVKATQATVDRLRTLTAYESVTVPFDGVITARNIDVGDLVSADAASGAPMFTIQREDTVRVQAYVPQSDIAGIRDGVPVDVNVAELPGHVFSGKVARSAMALDPNSRTMLVQADVANPDHLLHPGLYAEVTFDIPRTHPGVVVPSEAVLFDGSGLHVDVIDGDDRVHVQKISIFRDFGTSVELADGLKGGERLALQPPAGTTDGQAVQPIAPPGPAPGATASKS